MLNILHAINIPLALLNTNGKVHHINHSMEKYLGILSQDIIGKHGHTLLHPSNLEQVSCPLCQAIKYRHSIDKIDLFNPHKQKYTQYSMNYTTIDSQEKVILTLIDTTQFHTQTQKIKKLNQRMALASHGYKAGLYEWNMVDNSAYLSAEWKVMLGYDKNEPFAPHLSTWKKRVHPDDIDNIMKNVQQTLVKREIHIEAIHRLKHKDGHWIWIMGRGLIQYDSNGRALSMTGIHTDISKCKKSEVLIQKQANKLYKLAHYDMLTGLANRVLLTEKLTQSILTSKQTNRPLALMFIDFNKFKPINDSLGHHIGDKILKIIAKRLKNIIRSKDIAARFGGDEFIILIHNSHDFSSIKNKIVNIFNEPIKVAKHTIHLSCSIGISIYPTDATTIDGLLKDADKKMYKQKYIK